jgi:hypothetical protein
MKTNTQFFTTATALLCLLGASANAQSVEKLLNKLVDKGVLSKEEAADLAKDSDKDDQKKFDTQYARKTGFPDWVTYFKWAGDFRGRYEEHNAEDADFHVRDRYRIRARLGAYIGMLNSFDIGIRFATGNPQTNPGGTLVGGQPITANQDLNSLESRKFLWLDAAYARWTPLNNGVWFASATIGKMDNPFQLSNMTWDYDVDPEGGAFQVAHTFNEHHTLKGTGAFYILDELNQSNPDGAQPTRDPSIAGGQMVLESKWTPKIESSLGVAVFTINSHDALSAKTQPFYNSGNTRDPKTFALKYDFNPIIGTASFAYKLDRFPFYNGPFPIRPMFEYMANPGAPRNNIGYRAGINFGKAGKKGTWEIDYRYQRLEADAWFDALTDDDNTAFFAKGNPQLVGTGKAEGIFGGTNIKGHYVGAIYSFTDFMNVSTWFYLNDTIIDAPGASGSDEHFMAEMNFKF